MLIAGSAVSTHSLGRYEALPRGGAQHWFRPCRRSTAVSQSAKIDVETVQVDRRTLMASSGLAIAGTLFGGSNSLRALAEEGVTDMDDKVKFLEDGILAYKYAYPIETMSGKRLSMNLAHKPERYSSAAPLTPDARQRIVSEVLDFKNFVSVSMTVGPPSGVLNEGPPDTWKPMDVAMTVLTDRSTYRTTTGQRTSLNDIENVRLEERDGQKFWVYEHVTQGSPTPQNTSRETYRHAWTATTYRPGMDGTPYLYTLNLACPQELWDDLEPVFKHALATFQLTPTSSEYVPPDKDPWRFF